MRNIYVFRIFACVLDVTKCQTNKTLGKPENWVPRVSSAVMMIWDGLYILNLVDDVLSGIHGLEMEVEADA